MRDPDGYLIEVGQLVAPENVNLVSKDGTSITGRGKVGGECKTST
jgi:hypothetical protein